MPIGAKPTFREAVRFWLKLGCIDFGGDGVGFRSLFQMEHHRDAANFQRNMEIRHGKRMNRPGNEMQGWKWVGNSGRSDSNPSKKSVFFRLRREEA